MMMHCASAAGLCDQAEHQEVFLDGYHVGVQDSLRSYHSVPVTPLAIDRFISTTISHPPYPRVWNAGYLAGWLAGMVSIEGPTGTLVAQVPHVESEDALLFPMEVIVR